jgi:nucleoside-diphosphate-sugar epimerase
MDSSPNDFAGIVFVTGASGFIGRHLLKQLLKQKRKVIALCRKPEELRDLDNPYLRLVTGTLDDQSSYASELINVNTIYHLASRRIQNGVTLTEYLKTNVESALALARLSVEAGVH